MGFTVIWQDGKQDVEFEEYARLLRQKGMDLAKLPRVPEPDTGRRWVPVWNSQTEARAFADELKKRTKNDAWKVVKVTAPTSEGPLGPIEIQVARHSIGWSFALNPLSRLMVQKVFPGSCHRKSVLIHTETKQDFQSSRSEVADLADPVAVILTGLSIDTMRQTFGGYRIYDPIAKKELVASAPVQA
jgi:hypothetical protein